MGETGPVLLDCGQEPLQLVKVCYLSPPLSYSHYNYPIAITCPELSLIANGAIEYSPDSRPFLNGSTASYSCTDGHMLSGVEVRTCEGDGFSTRGVWSGNAPICIGNLSGIIIAHHFLKLFRG